MGMSIVYVEDDEISRTVLQILLIDQGHTQLKILSDSSNFMEEVKALPAPPDLFFLDIHVKPLSGFDMLKLLRSDPNYEKKIIVALTASVMNEEVDLLRQAGFNGVIAKPIDAFAFPKTFQRLIKGETVWQIV